MYSEVMLIEANAGETMIEDVSLEHFKADLRPLLAEYDAVSAELKTLDETLALEGELTGEVLGYRNSLLDTLEAISTTIINRVGRWLEEG